MQTTPQHLELYQQEEYWRGNKSISGYDDYLLCKGVLYRWSGMVHAIAAPSSILDVGAAYGFVVDYFTQRGIQALGVEPSHFCLSQVDQEIKEKIVWGALPDQGFFKPADTVKTFHTVTCTEVLEHVPPELIPSSLQTLAKHTESLLICLIMLDCPEAHEDEGHLCLKDRVWWEAQFDATGLNKRADLEQFLNNYSYSKAMNWSGRFFVRERVHGTT